jgi:hypothetical protein
MTSFVTTSYVSRVCSVPPLVAHAALAELISTTPVLLGEGWELRLGDNPNAATLIGGWPYRAAVSVEIERWSRSRILIGLRHHSRAVPWWTETYFTCAHAAVTLIADLFTAWADAPLRGLDEEQRQLVQRCDRGEESVCGPPFLGPHLV